MRTHLRILALLGFIVTACASREPASYGGSGDQKTHPEPQTMMRDR